MTKYRIGYVDEDPNQVQKIERKLRPYFEIVDYNIEKGLPIGELLKRIYESEINLLMVDYLMVDKGILTYNGDELARDFAEIRPQFPTLIFTNEEAQARPHVDNPNIIYDKKMLENEDLPKLVDIITKNIIFYENYIGRRKDIINELIEKGEQNGLSELEKNALLEAQLELRHLDKWSLEVPQQLLEEEKVDALSRTRKEAEQYLESLLKKRKEK